MAVHEVADYYGGDYHYYDDGAPDAESVFGEEIEELLPVGLSADDKRLVRVGAVSAFNSAAAFVAPYTDAAVVSSLSAYEVIGDREVITDDGQGVVVDAIGRGLRVLDVLDDRFSFAKGSARARLFQWGMNALPYVVDDDDLGERLSEAWLKELRYAWGLPANTWKTKHTCADRFERSSRRPLRSARRVRSARHVRTVRSGCSPGRQDDPEPAPPLGGLVAGGAR